ncbi:MAG: FIST C-terminal domain-containing protein [Defluviitaleaceae bacterium]|nr:FIST C-terminal domain-containing protein [Defluviitaleaceae bacterium]
MIKSHIVNIKEIDDVEFALEELEEQMAGFALLKNSVGLVSLNLDYINSGVYAAVADALDFPLIGGTAIAMSANGEIGAFLLSIMVLTSDDCEFSCAVSSETIPATGVSVAEVTQECYKKAASGLSGDPALTFLFTPFMAEYHYTSEYTKAASAFNAKVPVFGTMSLAEINNTFTFGRVVLENETYDNRVAILTVSGEVNPKFYIESVSDSSITMPNIGTVTKSTANIVTEINNIDIKEFLESIGYDPGDMVKGAQITGFIVKERNEGTEPVTARFTNMLQLKDGMGVFGNEIPEGSVLSVAMVSKEDITVTAKSLVDKIKENHEGGTILMFSCAGRMFALLNEPMKEYVYLNENLTGSFNYMVACSGGEICPTLVTGERVHNNGHNNTIVACVLS